MEAIAHQDTGRLLLVAGLAAAILFFVVPTIEIFRRPGFDLDRHAISMLSLGEGGWRMKAVFVVSGVLTLLCAVGLPLVLGWGWAGVTTFVLVAAYGSGLILAGIYDAPAGLGFPAGTPLDQQPVMTREANLHGMAFMIAFGGLILSFFAFGAYFLTTGNMLSAAGSIAVGVALPVLIALGVSSTVKPGIAFYWAAMLGWLWLGVIILRLRMPV